MPSNIKTQPTGAPKITEQQTEKLTTLLKKDVQINNAIASLREECGENDADMDDFAEMLLNDGFADGTVILENKEVCVTLIVEEKETFDPVTGESIGTEKQAYLDYEYLTIDADEPA